MLGISGAALCGLLSVAGLAAAVHPEPQYQVLPPLREQASIVDGWTEQRKVAVPQLLRKHGVDAWIISQLEHGEETVFWSLKPATMFSARRRTLYLFLADAAGPSSSGSYEWVDLAPGLWGELGEVLEAHGVESIAVNIHPQIQFSSGLQAGELQAIREGLGERWSSRLVTRPMLGVEFIGTMPEDRLPWYRKMQETAWALISEAFSEEVITPGKTTTEDVEWWMRDKIQALNYTTWFHPDVSILDENPWGTGTRKLIEFGDLIHCDFGVTAMGLNTDTQHLAYVLGPGETEEDIPASLLEGLHKGNRLQDIVRGNMRVGETGNAILRASRLQMQAEGIRGLIYCHAIGDWGHSAGTVIGMHDYQAGVPVLGDLPLIDRTWYSIELLAEHFVPERNATIQFPLEENVYWNPDAQTWDWVYGQQTRLHVVRTPATGVSRIRGGGGGGGGDSDDSGDDDSSSGNGDSDNSNPDL